MTMHDKIDCIACEAWTDAYLDNELDIATAGLVNAHLAQCPACAAQYRETADFLAALRGNAPRYEAPGLAEAVMARLQAENQSVSGKVRRPKERKAGWLQWLAPGVAAAAMAMALTLYVSVPAPSDRLADEVVSDHVRSLMEHHLMDVESSDKHTVKPWFTGKLDFSPPVTDFATEGFPLIGGRLDYLDHRTVAALSYRHGKHLINVFIMPDNAQDRPPAKQVMRGYNIVSWTKNRMMFYAISDMNAEELSSMAQMLWNAD